MKHRKYGKANFNDCMPKRVHARIIYRLWTKHFPILVKIFSAVKEDVKALNGELKNAISSK